MPGHLDAWTPRCLDGWTPGRLDAVTSWRPGRLDAWTHDHAATRKPSKKARKHETKQARINKTIDAWTPGYLDAWAVSIETTKTTSMFDNSGIANGTEPCWYTNRGATCPIKDAGTGITTFVDDVILRYAVQGLSRANTRNYFATKYGELRTWNVAAISDFSCLFGVYGQLESYDLVIGDNVGEVGNITSVYPSAGQGTATVTIQGANLLGGGSEAVSVSLCGVVAQIIEGKNNDTYMVVRANSGPVSVGAATGNVVIESDTGVKITAINRFTYSTVTAIAPELGQGGTVVTITGIALLGDDRTVQSVTLDGEEVEEVLSSSSTEIVVIASAIEHGQDQTGTAVITLDNDETVESVAGRNDELTHTFTYTVPGAVTSVSPARGQLNTVVTIVGTELFGQGLYLVNVTLAGVAAQIVNQSNTEVIVIASASDGTNVGTVELTSDTGAVVSVSNAWKYVNVGDVTGVSPNNGQLNTLITITGTDLMAGGNGLVAVSLAGVAVKELVSNSSTEVVVVANFSATTGAGDILFESENGASVLLEDGFTYVAVPNITDVSPAVGQTNTIVTISGTGLFAGAENITTVTLNNVDAEILSRSDDQVIVQACETEE